MLTRARDPVCTAVTTAGTAPDSASMGAFTDDLVTRLQRRLGRLPAAAPTAESTAEALAALVREGLCDLPLPGAGHTLGRWQALAAVAAHDLSLAKLYEGHTDALAILAELGGGAGVRPGSTWGTWAAEPPDARLRLTPCADGRVTLTGRKGWCSGAAFVSHGLMTAWSADGRGPFLVAVDMRQAGVQVKDSGWCAVGMSASASLDVVLNDALGTPIGNAGDYLTRRGFWHGGAGIAACWYGGATGLARALHRAAPTTSSGPATAFRLAALGQIDLALQQTAAVLRDAAEQIDADPAADASALALRTRLSAEASAARVLDEAGRSLGAAAFCRDPGFARRAADLPVFVRQSHAERDLAALGERCMAQSEPWHL